MNQHCSLIIVYIYIYLFMFICTHRNSNCTIDFKCLKKSICRWILPINIVIVACEYNWSWKICQFAFVENKQINKFRSFATSNAKYYLNKTKKQASVPDHQADSRGPLRKQRSTTHHSSSYAAFESSIYRKVAQRSVCVNAPTCRCSATQRNAAQRNAAQLIICCV